MIRRSNDGDANEQSPLLSPRSSADVRSPSKVPSQLSDDDWQANRHLESKSSWFMFLLTLGGIGLQMGWAVEMSNGSPYLISLGLNKALLALVWIAGPLTGVLVQPVVGIKSDRSRIRWGKRRPYIVGGTIGTVLALMILAWTREIVGGFLGIFGVDRESRGVAITVMAFATLAIYILDFAINVFQAALRAFIVDCAPPHQQETANAWVSRMNGVGNIIGMLCGTINLPKLFPFLGQTQFKGLCAIASIFMAATVTISCATIQERDPTTEGEPIAMQGILSFWKDLLHAVRRLPPQIVKVCQVQFMAWLGWFPFLFYTTTYIAEIYVEPFFEENPNMSEEEVNRLWEQGTRRGSRALFAFAITTFLASVFLPFIITPTYETPVPTPIPTTPLTPTASASSHWNNSIHPSRQAPTLERFNTTMRAVLSRLRIPSLTIRRTWLISHLLFTVCMWLTFVVRGVGSASFLVALIGIPWAVTQWVPFALISAEISRRDAIRRGRLRAPPTRDGALLAAGEDDAADQAGVVLGIHNVAISAPQVIATLISSVIFKVLQKPRGVPGDESVAWCLRFGGLCAIGAAYLASRVGSAEEDEE
ncbi:hypothetical protein EJ06DRAFT_469817 [Trichodelitschia bisporula]|uniref:MFS general substrate transporter n=1 Tax=Trichodelitschia bisporula TaxID=703511 RepID=A0A6G1I8D3_9PEZI|nr:hypothetical protein EJ06DRAFT_469817 [Trichodelitschia bisporula]